MGLDFAFMHGTVIERYHKTINWSKTVHLMDYKCPIAIDPMWWQSSCRSQGCWIKSTKCMVELVFGSSKIMQVPSPGQLK